MTARDARLAALAIGGPALAVVLVVAAARTAGYDTWRDTVSRLGSPGQPWAMVVRVAFVCYGMVVITATTAVSVTPHPSKPVTLAVMVYGVCAAIAGLAPKDMPGTPRTGVSELHVAAAVVGGAAVVTAMVLVGRLTSSRPLRLLSNAMAAITVASAAIFRFTWGSRYYGATERAVLVPPVAWLSAIAVLTLLMSTSSPSCHGPGRPSKRSPEFHP